MILGTYEGKTSPIPLPVPLTYLHVRLRDGERWTYRPASDHDVAWFAVNAGKVHVAGDVFQQEMAVFAEGTGEIALVAEGAVELVIGSAVKHPYPLVSGYYSVHTNAQALAAGERTIAALAKTPAVIALHAPG